MGGIFGLWIKLPEVPFLYNRSVYLCLKVILLHKQLVACSASMLLQVLLGFHLFLNSASCSCWVLAYLCFETFKSLVGVSFPQKHCFFFNRPLRMDFLSSRLEINGNKLVRKPWNSCNSFLHVRGGMFLGSLIFSGNNSILTVYHVKNFGGVRGVIVTIVGNGYSGPNGNPVCISDSANTLGKGMNPIILSSAMNK